MSEPQTSETNQRLGYPADTRLLIINADDFGMCHASNAAIFRAITEGVVSSTTLMVPCPWALHAMRLLSENPEIAFGVHLTAMCDGTDYRWGSVMPRDKVPSLIDETGYFYRFERMDEYLAQIDLDELEMEFRAQIEAVLAAGLKPTHLDWHSLRIHKKPELLDVMFKLARAYGLALRVRERPLIEKMQSQGYPTNDYDFLDSYFVETAVKQATLAQMLRDLPTGLSEWALHPGFADGELLAIEPDGAAVRQADFDFAMSAAAREVIAQEGITLISYKPLQDAWQAR